LGLADRTMSKVLIRYPSQQMPRNISRHIELELLPFHL
jgi:hypothetical protein